MHRFKAQDLAPQSDVYLTTEIDVREAQHIAIDRAQKARIAELEAALRKLKYCINIDGTRVLAQPRYMLGIINEVLENNGL